MSDLIKNGALAAKLKAKKGRLLNDDDYKALCALGSVSAIAAYLSKTEGYKRFVREDFHGGIHRDSLEDLIYLSLIDDYESLYTFSGNSVKKFLDLYYLKREIWVVKSAMYAVANQDENIHLSLPSHHHSFDSAEVESAKSMEELVKALGDTPYASMIKEGGSIFEIETKLDKYYFEKMFEAVNNADKDERPAARELIGSETDATNILWIYRAKKYYNMSPERIKGTILKHNYHLSKDLLQKLTEAAAAENVAELIEKSPYRNLLNDKETEMGMALSTYLYGVNKKIMNKYPYSAVSALAYIHLKRTEIQNITAIIECVRYGVPQDKAYRHVIKECDEVGDS